MSWQQILVVATPVYLIIGFTFSEITRFDDATDWLCVFFWPVLPALVCYGYLHDFFLSVRDRFR